MTPGLFDLPAPLLQWLDDRLTTIVPAGVSVAIWAAVGAVLCLEVYRVTSPQKKIDRVKQDARAAQQSLASYDGEFDGAWPLMKKMLGLSLKRVGIVVPATLVAALPVIVLLVWLSNSYGYHFPGPEGAVAVDVMPPPLEGRWVPDGGPGGGRVQSLEGDGRVVLDYHLARAVPVLHKRQWWNWLIANPAGYLPDDGPLSEVRLDLPRRELLPAGPGWVRGWEAVFIPVLFVVALAYKSARRIV